ncbi:hypothetical protein [Synoicihabitans lomoniglobus]|uniref:Uncharacterized protein n=1 Tax=Synoicihabitans lomoniglobus TaxID=2909285 RepID=A0AAE9ZVP6_9BACT|nr:hypothetical protein [Opitutaceae bacterium LMO-M01]WED63323.1 hypothetical protein PXH66_13375 [Opitutaceae bacterium LMO-M01]
MGKTYTIRLESNDLGQVLDGLRCRAEAWRGTLQYHETGTTPHKTFAIEESRDANEARGLTDCYDRLVTEIERQIRAQQKQDHTPASDLVKNLPPPSVSDGFCIFIDTIFEGKTVAVTDESDRPCIFNSEHEGHIEIVEGLMTRLQQFLDGEREFDDATTIDEYVEQVHKRSDGTLVDKKGNSLFGG